MSSYADRLQSFNQSVSATNDHIANLKNTLSNPEYKENPLKQGLEVASTVLGTGEGLARIRGAMKDGSELRNIAKANYNKFGQISDAINNMPKNLNSIGSDAVNRAGTAAQSTSSQISDSGKAASQSARSVAKNITNPLPQNPTISDAVDNGISGRIDAIQGSATPTSDANDISKAINGKLTNALSPDEISNVGSKIANTSVKPLEAANDLPEGVLKRGFQQQFLNFKNNIANDQIARKQQGLGQPDGYTNTGQPIHNSTANAGDNTANNLTANTASVDSNGSANAGSNAAKNAIAGDSSLPQVNLPNNVNAANVNVNLPDIANPIPQGSAEDITTAARSAASNVTQGTNILQKGQQLGLQAGRVPSQSGGTVQGLVTSATANNPSAQANIVSQAQQGNASQHAAGQASGNQASANTDTIDPNANISSKIGGAGGTEQQGASGAANAGATVADDAGNSIGKSGISAALGTEETLDTLAPEAGPLAPILEAGSLLATLGTGIASLFEPDKKETKPASPPPKPQTISVGANLKAGAGGNVGAF